MRTLNDLKLCPKMRKKVEEWLTEWLDMFIKQAQGAQGWVYRADFEKDDFFFFTGCKDILNKDPETKAHETNPLIKYRKQKVLMQLFVKTLLGQKLGTVIECGHCGYKGCWINGLPDGNGHWVYCPKCYKTDIHVFPGGYDNCMNTIRIAIAKKESKLELSSDLKKTLHDKLLHKKRPLQNPVCDKCGSKGPFDYAVGLCNNCYKLETSGVS